jgi:hypothetical protein
LIVVVVVLLFFSFPRFPPDEEQLCDESKRSLSRAETQLHGLECVAAQSVVKRGTKKAGKRRNLKKAVVVVVAIAATKKG